jgi:hypothetical protein
MKNKLAAAFALLLLIHLNGFAQNSSTDFLNNYFFKQVPLINNTFKFELAKVVIGKTTFTTYDNYEESNRRSGVASLPEILDVENFTFYGVKSNFKIQDTTRFNQLVTANTKEWFNAKMPKVEVLKNKLLTISYPDSTEESFLLNVKQPSIEDDNNNKRKVLQMELANEEVKADGTNNTARDIVWRFFVIYNDCYLALSKKQLERLKVSILSSTEGVLLLTNDGEEELVSQQNFTYHKESKTSGNGLYIGRDKDSFMDSGYYIDPDNMIFLFKLKQN